jgi:tetratricopeptide (TPR) repeat protein
VLAGTARFVLAGETAQAQTGTFVHVPAGVLRTAFAQEAGTTILAIGGGREGEPYRPGGWEVWSPLRSLMQAGRHQELVARARPLLDDGPAYPVLLYNVACSESLLGRTDDALDHLRRAIQLMPEIARFARDDQDLAALREEPGFAELISD